MDVITFIFKNLEDAQNLLSSKYITSMIKDNEVQLLFDPQCKEVSFKILGDEEDNKRIYHGIVDLVEFYTYYD